jgi:DNA primase catalytic subunit
MEQASGDLQAIVWSVQTVLSPVQIEKAYLDNSLKIPDLWNLSRKHFRLETLDGKFIKLNRIANRLTEHDLKYYCWKFKPAHVYFSVLDWLFPERVGTKRKASCCIPLNGNYVVDIDSYMFTRYLALFKHLCKQNREWQVCEICLDLAKKVTLQACETIERYYSDLAIVFSGCRGFHIHVLDFNYKDTATFRPQDPLWCHHAARYRFTRVLSRQTNVFDRHHFVVSVDPMRVVTVPGTLNAKTGLVCSYLGNRKDFEKLTITQILEKSKSFAKYHRTRYSYPETLKHCFPGR